MLILILTEDNIAKEQSRGGLPRSLINKLINYLGYWACWREKPRLWIYFEISEDNSEKVSGFAENRQVKRRRTRVEKREGREKKKETKCFVDRQRERASRKNGWKTTKQNENSKELVEQGRETREREGRVEVRTTVSRKDNGSSNWDSVTCSRLRAVSSSCLKWNRLHWVLS